MAGESFELYFCDILKCIRALYKNPAFVRYLVFTPEQHFSTTSPGNQLYHDMHTGKWWWATQVYEHYMFARI